MSRKAIILVATLVAVIFGVWFYLWSHASTGRRLPASVAQSVRSTQTAQEQQSARMSVTSGANASTGPHPVAQGREFRQGEYSELRKKFRASEGTAYGPADRKDVGLIAGSIKPQLRNPSLWPIVKDVMYGKTSALEDALNSGLNPNVVVEKGNGNVESLLDMAIDVGQRGSIKALVEHGAAVNLNQYDLGKDGAGINGSTYVEPLVDAAMAGEDDVVKYLLEHGANINRRNNLNPIVGGGTQTPLAAAAAGGNVSTVYLLLTHGASVNSVLDQNGYVPQNLIQAARSKPEYAAVVKLLVNYGATVPPSR